MSMSRTTKIYWSQFVVHLLLLHIKLSKKVKRGLQLVPLPNFLHNFWKNIFLTLYSAKWPNLIVWLSLLQEMLDNKCIVIVSFLAYFCPDFFDDVENGLIRKGYLIAKLIFAINLFLLSRFPHHQKSRDKNLNSLRTKRAFNMN